jgi:hypothetical protein
MTESRALHIATPPGWPETIPAPGTDDWQAKAIAWLYEQIPPEWRRHDEYWQQHPRLLARLAKHTAFAQLEEIRRGYSTARVDLRDVDPHVRDELLAVYATEGERIKTLQRTVQLLADALGGVRWRPAR